MNGLTVRAAAELPATPHPKLGKAALERRRRPLTILFAVLIAMLVLTCRSRWPVAGGGREALFVVGMSLACIGAIGRIWCSLFIAGYKSRRLIVVGPYSVCRNPLYFFSAIGMAGIGLTTETFSIPLLLIVFFAIYYPTIIEREEQRLLARHGEPFEEYCRQVPAFWPRWRSYVEPEIYLMSPRAVRKSLADAFWFVGLAAVVHAEAHAASFLGFPELFRVW